MKCAFVFTCLLFLVGCSQTPEYDLVIRGGMVFDGSGAPPVVADVAIVGDSIAAVGEKLECVAHQEIDASSQRRSLLSRVSDTSSDSPSFLSVMSSDRVNWLIV